MNIFKLVSIVFAVVSVSDLMTALRSDQTRRERTARWISVAASAAASLLLFLKPFEEWTLYALFGLAFIVIACQTMFVSAAFVRMRRLRAKEQE
jgi:uncharacterized membrane protein HdeD (DUF308 family)